MNEIRKITGQSVAETERIRNEVDKAASLVAAATVLARQGRLVSVVSLRKKVSDICMAVKEAGYRNCLPLKEALAELLKRTDVFEREMVGRFSFLNAEENKEEET